MRMTNALLNQATDLGVADFMSVGNVAEAAQLGVGPNLPKLDATTPLVMNPAVLVVTHLPTMWDNIPLLQATLKKLIECHAKSVTGIDFGYDVVTTDTPVGHDGQQLSMPTNTTRSPVSPSFTWQEIYGNPIWNLHYRWICDIQNPDTQASQLSAALLNEEDVPPYLVSSFSMSMVAIQFDPTELPDRIIDAAFYTAMFPTHTGELGLERTIGTHKSPERSITYKALVQHNNNTRELGRLIAKVLQMHKPNYLNATTATGVSANLTNFGVNKEVKELLREFQPMSS